MYVDLRNVYCELGTLSLVIDFISILVNFYTQSSKAQSGPSVIVLNEWSNLPAKRT